ACGVTLSSDCCAMQLLCAGGLNSHFLYPLSDLRGFIAAYIYLYAFIHGCFCNLRKPLARYCIHIFLTTCRADLGRYITNDNGCLTSTERDTAPALSLCTFSCTLP